MYLLPWPRPLKAFRQLRHRHLGHAGMVPVLCALGALLAVPTQAVAAVATLGTPASQYSTSSTLTSFTVPAGNDRLLVVGLGDPNSPTNPTAVTYNGVAMSQGNATTDGGFSNDAIWYLKLGTSASATTGNIVVTFAVAGNASSARFIGASAYSGVDQTTPVDLNGPKISGSIVTTGDSLNVTSQTGALVFDHCDTYGTSAQATQSPGTGQTLLNNAGGAINPTGGYGHYTTSIKAGAASVTMAWTGTAEAILHLTMNIRAAAAAAPTVTTSAATSVTATTATLNGTVNANGASSTVTFNYGLTTGYGTNATAAQSPVAGSSGTAVSAALTGLTASTTYHFRVSSTNTGGTSNGSDLTFTTAAPPDTTPPTVVSIVRQLPSTAQATNSTSATFRVTFSEAVNTPTTANFAVSAVNSGSIVGTVNSVTSVSGSTSIYDVAVTITSGTGEFRLKVVD